MTTPHLRANFLYGAPNGQTWLVTGGRNFRDQGLFNFTMQCLVDYRGTPSLIIHGGATGADAMANSWAIKNNIQVRRVKANWIKHGLAAGPIRNQEMIDVWKPSLVIAFPGQMGTLDMTRRAKAAGIEIAWASHEEVKST
jgi:hypothetical protein